MYRPLHYVHDDIAALHAQIRARVFATVAAVNGGAVHLAYAPVILDRDGALGRIRFHLARANPLCACLEGAQALVSFVCADAYISPDWYAGEGFVPTWNYIAIEGEGIAEPLDRDGLAQLLGDLSAQEEARLAPKPVWTMDKLSPAKRDMLFAAIEGFALPFTRLEGKFKLSQEKDAADRAGVVAALEARGDPSSLAVARAMRKT